MKIRKSMTAGEFASFLFVAFCCYFMTAILPISPIYFTFFLGVVVVFCNANKVFVPKKTILVYLIVFLYSFWFLIGYFVTDTTYHEALVTFVFALYYIFVDISLYQIDEKNKIQNLLKLYFVLFIIYYIFDIYMRYTNMLSSDVPTWIAVNPVYSFYLLKDGGLTGDSNTIGVFCVTFFSVILYSNIRKILSAKYLFIAFILVVFSCSRASILACIFIYIFWHIFYKQNIYIKVFSSFIVCIVVFYSFYIFIKDPSFLTKIEIFQKTFEYLLNTDMTSFLFGCGPNKSTNVLGRYAHNIWSILLVEYGFVTFILFLLMILVVIVDTGKYFFIIAIPYFIVSLSFTPIFLQFLFTGFALIKHIDRIYQTNKK